MEHLDLLSFIPFRLNRLAAEFSNALADDYARFGIDIPEWRVLATLGMHGEPRSANYVVRCTRTHKSRISRAVSHLVELGYIDRQEADGDRREIMLRLTLAGRDAYERICPILREREEKLLSVLSQDDRIALERVLLALESSLDLVRCPTDERS